LIAKLDATANEIDGVNIQGYPTLKFYGSKSKQPVDYDGDREFEGIVSFLNEQLGRKETNTEEPVEKQHDDL